MVHPANEYLQYYSREDAFFDVEEREKEMEDRTVASRVAGKRSLNCEERMVKFLPF